jgi:hypothetical protein
MIDLGLSQVLLRRSNNLWETLCTHQHFFLAVLCGAGDPNPVLGWPCVGVTRPLCQGDPFCYWIGVGNPPLWAGDPNKSQETQTARFGGWVFIPLHPLFFKLTTTTPSTPPKASISISQLHSKPILARIHLGFGCESIWGVRLSPF